ncbi:glycosyltransferase family 9 protein [Methylacidiphilum caldifontis]|uniref:ADP-heptose--LPS heptosyltransferase n=1 Tax=Methylacidiphilum caldifontis TaxID=2795386 RepID=A0A4Y8PAN2_9BACT|nr:glycosyltransferase family 9 protein [Methylacidiphilum caldifontis]TFE67472.1 ADP-heptose--LPS heptosyltransferase [Methylacidiphilum caldifontis]
MAKQFEARNIVVIRGGGLGDFIHTLPALFVLRNHYSFARIDLLGTPRYGILGEKRYYFDKVYDIESSFFTPLFSEEGKLGSKLLEFFSHIDLVLCYSPDNQGVLRRNIEGCGVKKIIYCPPFPGQGNVLEWLLQPVVELGIIDSVNKSIPPPLIFLSSEDEKNALTVLSGLKSNQKIVALHPGSGNPKKNWPSKSWKTFCQELKKRGYNVVLILGPAELDRVELKSIPADLKVINLELPTVAAILKKSALYCGHDSGLTHLAVSVGCPTIALFGPTDPYIWMYRNIDKKRCRVLWNRGEKVSFLVDEVLYCVFEMLEECNHDYAVDILR